MAYDSRKYEDEMDRFGQTLQNRGVSVSAYAGLAVVQTPHLAFDKMRLDKKSRTVLVGSATYFRWTIDRITMRREARDQLDRIIAAAWRRAGVDDPTASK